MIRIYLGGLCLLLGAVAFVLSVVGVFRFKYVLNRLHASAIADTLGTLLTALGLFIIRGFSMPSLKLVLIVIAMWVTGPVCTNRIAWTEVRSAPDLSEHCKEEK